MKTLQLFFSALILLVVVSCSKENADEEARRKENEKLQESLGSVKLDFYKAIKIALRYSAAPQKDPDTEKARQTMFKIAGTSLMLANQVVDSVQPPSAMELLALGGELYKAKDVLNKTEEDSLPTILGNICYYSGGMKSCEVPDVAGLHYDNNFEHTLIGLLWFASVKGPKEFSFYELHKADESKISQYDLAILTSITKSLVYYENEFPYNGMDRADAALSLIEANKSNIEKNPLIPIGDSLSDGTQTYFQYHGLATLLRGLNKKKAGKEDESFKDFELFLADAEKGGLDNELTWLTGSYVYIKNEDMDKALASLNKLERSTILGEPEKKAVKEIKSYLENRNTESALNTIKDKIAFGSIAFDLMKSRAENSKVIASLSKTENGKRFRKMHNELEEKAAYLNMLENKGGAATDLVKGLFSN